MKQRVVSIKAQDPLLQAVQNEWSAKEHQDAMARATAAIQAWRAEEKKTAPADNGKRAPSFRALGIDEVE